METIKILKLKSRDALCYVKEEGMFRFRFPGVFDQMKSYRDVFLSLYDVRFGIIQKTLDVKFYYGKQKKLMPKDFCDLKFVYASLDELCLLLQDSAVKEIQKMEEKEKEKEEEEEEKKEKEEKMFPIVSYECGRCSMKIPKGHMLLIDSKLNYVLKLKAKDDGTYPTCLLVGDHLGDSISFYEESEKICHFSLENMIDSVTLNSRSDVSNIMNSFDLVEKRMGKPLVFKKCQNALDEIVLTLKNDSFYPFSLDCKDFFFEISLCFMVPI